MWSALTSPMQHQHDHREKKVWKVEVLYSQSEKNPPANILNPLDLERLKSVKGREMFARLCCFFWEGDLLICFHFLTSLALMFPKLQVLIITADTKLSPGKYPQGQNLWEASQTKVRSERWKASALHYSWSNTHQFHHVNAQRSLMDPVFLPLVIVCCRLLQYCSSKGRNITQRKQLFTFHNSSQLISQVIKSAGSTASWQSIKPGINDSTLTWQT